MIHFGLCALYIKLKEQWYGAITSQAATKIGLLALPLRAAMLCYKSICDINSMNPYKN